MKIEIQNEIHKTLYVHYLDEQRNSLLTHQWQKLGDGRFPSVKEHKKVIFLRVITLYVD